jgi:predicted DCC family thiol-disulfide oxidoreductase YuxK
MAPTLEDKQTRPVLIFDGNCPICRKTMDWIRGNSDKDTFEMLTCQSEDVIQRYPFIDRASCMQAMQLILPDGTVLPGEKALPEILKRTKRYDSAAGLFSLPGAETISRLFYRWFADHRYDVARILFPGTRKRVKK